MHGDMPPRDRPPCGARRVGASVVAAPPAARHLHPAATPQPANALVRRIHDTVLRPRPQSPSVFSAPVHARYAYVN